MKISKKEYRFILEQLDCWLESNNMSNEKYDELKNSLEIKEMNWKRIAQNMLGLAVVFVIVAFLHLIVEEWIVVMISKFFALSDKFFMILMLIVFVSLVSLTALLEKRSEEKSIVIFNESILTLALSSFAGFLFYFSNVYNVNPHVAILFVLSTSFVALLLGLVFKSQFMWLLGIFGVLIWFGIHSSYADSQAPLFLGMNLAVRYFILISVLFTLYFLLQNSKLLKYQGVITCNLLLALLIISLWFVALFGNFSSYTEWKHSSSFVLLPGGIMLLIASLLYWFVGKKILNNTLKWLGALGLLGFIYTQYFLFLWNLLPASVFFFLLGISFFIIGRKAEIIWGR